MDYQDNSFRFELQYAGRVVLCEVIMQIDAYDVMFDHRLMGSIEHTEDWTWIQASGIILPEEIIEEIGSRIESYYK
jgi:hypothetical protein